MNEGSVIDHRNLALAVVEIAKKKKSPSAVPGKEDVRYIRVLTLQTGGDSCRNRAEATLTFLFRTAT